MAKSAWIKKFEIRQEIKTKGIEIQVDNDGKQMGDLIVTKTGITWCEGKSSKNVTKFSFDELDLLACYKKEALKAARKADKE